MILAEIVAQQQELTGWRRDLHAHPETAFQELRTAAFVAERLCEFGIEVHEGLAATGIVGCLRGRRDTSGRRIGLRADMDALDLLEANEFAHRSKTPDRMHACGHDGHTAMLLAAARHLARTRNFDGTVHFIFQPAEEMAGGGRRMVQEGLFERFPCDSVFGMHNWPDLESGRFSVSTGPVMASADFFDIEIVGRGGHAGMPHQTIDPVLVGAELVMAAQTLVSRTLAPTDAGVLSITRFSARSATNVIPNSVSLAGTARALSADVRDQLEAGLRRLVEALPAAHGARGTLNYRRTYPPTINQAEACAIAAAAAARTVGTPNVVSLAPSMGAEDFGFMLEACPGAYVWLGQRDAHHVAGLHTVRYDFNDLVLPIGASYWVHLVETALPVA